MDLGAAHAAPAAGSGSPAASRSERMGLYYNRPKIFLQRPCQ